MIQFERTPRHQKDMMARKHLWHNGLLEHVR
jgi:hypothetical protein